MLLSREFTRVIHFVFDELLPPCLRDSRWFCRLVFRLAFGKNADLFLGFKERVAAAGQAELNGLYKDINAACLNRPTDLNALCVNRIERDVLPGRILEVGAGRLYLAKRLALLGQVTAVDIDVPAEIQRLVPEVKVVLAPIDDLPFSGQSFETVVCTHTLEHVVDFQASVASLRRVAAQRLIVVVPRQRAYRFTFDAHLHFFPSIAMFLLAVRPPRNYVCELLGGDIYYMEDLG